MQLTKAVARRRMQCIRVTPYQMRKWGMLLAIAFVMNGWSFCSVESPEFKDFMAHVRPNFELPSAYMLRGVLLDGALAIVKLQQAAWMGDDSIAFHATVTLDGWSNSRMESVYSWNVIFPSRRVILLRADDLSAVTHSGDNLASKSRRGSCCSL
ncbi:TPA: hypothetical protein ACH3X1_013420 [Trebouxia sp. C0004]